MQSEGSSKDATHYAAAYINHITWPGLARLLAWELSSTPTCGQISQILVVGLLGVLRSIEIDSMIRLIDRR